MITKDKINEILEKTDLRTSRLSDMMDRECAGFKLENVVDERDDEYWIVVTKLTNLETNEVKYIQHIGSYDSWNGTEWGSLYDFDIVEPYQKTITAWKVVE